MTEPTWDGLGPNFWDDDVPADFFAQRDSLAPLVRIGRIVDRWGLLDPQELDPQAGVMVYAGGVAHELQGSRLWAYLLAPADPGTGRGGWGTPSDVAVTLETYLGVRDGEVVVDGLIRDGLLVPVSGDPDPVRAFARLYRITPYAIGLGSAQGGGYQDLGYEVGSAEPETVVDLVAQTVFDGALYPNMLGAARGTLAIATVCGKPTVSLGRLISGLIAQSAAGAFGGLWALEPAVADTSPRDLMAWARGEA